MLDKLPASVQNLIQCHSDETKLYSKFVRTNSVTPSYIVLQLERGLREGKENENEFKNIKTEN